MGKKKINREMLVAMVEDGLSTSQIADNFGTTNRAINYAIQDLKRAGRLIDEDYADEDQAEEVRQKFQTERQMNKILKGVKSQVKVPITIPEDRIRITGNILNGTIVVGSDAHYLPGPATVAHKGMVEIIKRLKPKMVVQNGDLFDFAQISKHPPLGWGKKYSVQQELEAVQTRLGEIEDVAGNATLVRTLGNHDMRFDSKLAAIAGQFEGVQGFSLADHIPRWHHGVSLFLNGNCMIKHRWKGGIHAAHNNAAQSGCHFITGHLHSLKVTPWTNYMGDWYGVDTGTLADVQDQQFEYAEDNPRNWRSGFVVLTFRNGILLPPEIAMVINDELYFRGERIV